MRKKIAVPSVGVDKYIVYEDGGKYCSDQEKVAEWGEQRGRKWEWGGGWMGDLGLVANTRRHSLEGQLRPLVLPALCSGLVVLPSFIEEHRWAIGATLIVSVAAGALITESVCQEYFQESTIIAVSYLLCSPQSISLITCFGVLVILLTPTIDVYVVERFFYVELN